MIFSIAFNINGNKDIGLQFDASVKERFLGIGFSFPILQESGNFPEVMERLHKSLIGIAMTFAPLFKKRPDRLSKPAALDALVFLKNSSDCVLRNSNKIKRITLNYAFVMLIDSI